ncbi:Rad14-like DNA excision repair protein [Ordospora colligata]|uniref:Rad14-like DNA excision repair protein n=1 Tax=Ordospora colligata OC4 TaxID=1354746 RepID=A0A0B2UK41_9MICR|nr:Rad14-like DNA excision repair protein [Ordospora colligata OC4]KHN69703.1 Rad14-like DNA excision repair protein [Ordospora colligata OC4]TBU15822.1 Rad14-like DNA excision repair protein [Ordospora colligata]TBU15950.1 Rad14-like DNA excision repair protein [Ordospora colligata]TBU18844.1 Rad14-like DNA excision repair protein [Ordospora colligata]
MDNALHDASLQSSVDMSEQQDGGFFAEEPKENNVFTKHVLEDDLLQLPLFLNNRCMYCNNMPIDTEIWKTFEIPVCIPCRHKMLKLVTKTACLDDYLLAEEDIKTFKYLERPNPRKGTWSRMYLYLQEQIEQAAISKWGSLDEIEIEKIRKGRKIEERKTKRLKAKIGNLRRMTRIPIVDNKKHVHVFSNDGAVSKCSCGLTVEQEEI